MSDIKLILNKIIFFGFHGLYESEKNNGQNFTIKVIINYKPTYNQNKVITNLIDYTKVYSHLKIQFNKTRFNYLESLIDYLIESLVNEYEQITYIKIKISKPELELDGNKDFITVERSITKK